MFKKLLLLQWHISSKSIKESRKNKGEGLVVFVNDKLCNPGNNILNRMWSKSGELLAVGSWPYYVPREFTQAKIMPFICQNAPPLTDELKKGRQLTLNSNFLIILINMFSFHDFTFTNATKMWNPGHVECLC